MLALAASAVSLHLHRKVGSQFDVAQRLHALESDLNDLYDRVEHWQRRDRTRRLRDANPPMVELPQPMPLRGTPEYKQMLRHKVRGNGGAT